MKTTLSYFSLLVFLLLAISITVIGQEENPAKSEFDFGTDVVSRYVWRGTDFGNSPSIQPFISYSISGLEIGTWGSVSTNGVNMQEVDLYASYTFLNDMFSVGVTDYFFPSSDTNKNSYFDYGDGTTGHIFEGSVSFNGTENIPVYFSGYYNFYGADGDNSVYLELGYNGTCHEIDYNIFIGAATGKGIYLTPDADGFNLVNVGLGVSKEVKITEKWSLPLFGQFIINPQAENIFLVFGFSL